MNKVYFSGKLTVWDSTSAFKSVFSPRVNIIIIISHLKCDGLHYLSITCF